MNKYLQMFPLASVFIMAGNTSAQAAESEADWYVSPMLSYIKSDNDRQADNDLGVMLGLGKKVNQKWNVEVNAVIDSLDFDSSAGEFKQRGLMIDGLYFFDRETEMQTYGIVGAGLMTTDIGATDSSNAMINVGVGMMQKISDSGIKVRADVRYRMDMDDESIISEDEFNDFMFNIGVSIPFGGSEKSKPAMQTVKAADTDNDGVIDSVDTCRNTKSGVQVDKKGCEIIKQTVKTIDSGVANNGDADNDGIKDSADNCPTTAAGMKVDSKGCELQQSFVLKGVNFITGSNVLEDKSKATLNDVASTLTNNADLMVEIAGYTDSRGNNEFNQRLSQKRAESVKAYLVTQGVDESRMLAKGYGVKSPIADNATAQGRSINRRVELHLIK